MELMTQEEFRRLIFDFAAFAQKAFVAPMAEAIVAHENSQTVETKVLSAYAAALERIASLEAQLAAQREQIERLLAECAHS